MEHSVNELIFNEFNFTIRLAIILKNDLINTLKLFQNYLTEVHFFYNIMLLIMLVLSCIYRYTSILV